jgi:hypothetical protein
MIYKTLLSLLMVASAAFAASEVQNSNILSAKQDSLESKRGLIVDGNIKGVLVNSYMESDQETEASTNRMPNAERSQFVSADIGFHFRPYESIRANLLLRLEAGMQNYFASSAKEISVPWLNVEGNIGNGFYWVVGDFRQQYSPLTLFAPTGVGNLLYEPLIFSRQKEMARKEALIEGNQRNLQGANLQFRHNLNETVGELRVDALFARLRRVQVLDFSGANGNILPNGNVPGAYQSANMDKWLVAGNLELLPLGKNVYVGATGMYVFDDSTSFTKTYRHENTNGKYGAPTDYTKDDYVETLINPYDVDPQQTVVASGRLGADVAGILGNKTLSLDVMFEGAMSQDKVYQHVMVDDTTEKVKDDKEKGLAFMGTVNAGYKLPMGLDLSLSVNGIMNDSAWFNNLAQSPQFFASRILNTDKDGDVVRFGVNAPLYTTFGALYYFDPKFSPAPDNKKNAPNYLIGTTDDPTQRGQTESYNIAPYNKNSWGNKVYTRSELDLMNAMTDPALQLSLPNGYATSNRMGADVDLKVGFKNFVELNAIASMFKQVKANVGLKEAEYMEYGGGLKFDVFKLLGFDRPLELSGSYKHSSKKQSLDDSFAGQYASLDGELKLDYMSGGLYFQYLPRLGLAAGIQMINMELDEIASVTKSSAIVGYEVPLIKGKQMQWMAGLDYTIAPGVFFALNFGMVTVENTYNTAAGAVGANMPNYADIAILDADGNQTGSVPEFKHQFSQTIVEALLNVEF